MIVAGLPVTIRTRRDPNGKDLVIVGILFWMILAGALERTIDGELYKP